METLQTKPWRFTSEEDYHKEAIKYVTKHIKNFSQKLDLFNNDKRKKIFHNISKYYEMYNSNYTPYILLENGVNIIKEDIQGWREFSAGINSPLNDIMLRTLIGKEFNFNYVATCLLHCNILITEDFIEDMIYVQSNLFRFDEWDDKHVEAVTNCAANSNIETKDKNLLELYNKDRLESQIITIKFNFNDYNGRLSSQFIEKYKDIIKSDKLLSLDKF